MNNLDLIDQVNFDQAKSAIRIIFDSVDDRVKLGVCRDITIDQISVMIDKFPLLTQKEILILLAEKYLSKWAM